MRKNDAVKSADYRRLLADEAGSIMLCLDPDGTVVFANPHADRMFGRLTGKSFSAVFPAGAERRVVSAILAAPGKYPAVTGEQVKKNGRKARVAWTFRPLRGGKGGLIAVGNETAPQGDTARERDLFKTLAENAPDVIARFDTGFRLLYISPAVKELTGLTPQDCLGKTIKEINIPRAAVQRWLEQLGFVARTLGRASFEFDLPAGPGAAKHLHTTLMPEIGVTGALDSIIAITRDVTLLKLAEEVLRRDKATLERLVDVNSRELMNAQLELQNIKRLSDIGTLAATIAHEVRNPLAAIKTAVYNIRRKAGTPLIESHLANIEKKIMESDQIIQNLLNYSRIKLPRFEKVALRELLQECLAAVEQKYSRWQVRGIFEELKRGSCTVDADPVHLRMLFMNIMDNAWQSFPDKQGTVTVTLRRTDRSCIVAVRDTGQGIDQQDITRIFDPFFTRKTCGVGLGLSICHQIIELHRGSISVESRPGEGTEFTVTMPLKQRPMTVANAQPRLSQYGC